MPRTKLYQRCDVCRRRRVKCDAKWPSCTPCVRNGHCCPGPTVDFDFKVQSFDRSTSTSSITDEHASTRLMRAADSAQLHRQNQSRSTFPPQPRPNRTDLLRLEFVQKVDSDAVAASLRYHSTAAYLKCLPSMIGYSTPLDAAIRCVCRATDHLHGLEATRKTSQWRVAYSQVLESLQKALVDPIESKRSETLAAVLVLEMLEVAMHGHFASGSWKHTDGIVQLIKYRGPGEFTNPIDFVVLEIQTPMVLWDYYVSRQDYVFKDHAWHGVFSRMMQAATPGQGRITSTEIRLLRAATQMPLIIESFKDWTMSGDFSQVSDGYVNIRASSVSKMRSLLKKALSVREECLSGNLTSCSDQKFETCGLCAHGINLIIIDAYLETILEVAVQQNPLVIADILHHPSIDEIVEESHAVAVAATINYERLRGYSGDAARGLGSYLHLVYRTATEIVPDQPFLQRSKVLRICRSTGVMEAMAQIDTDNVMFPPLVEEEED